MTLWACIQEYFENLAFLKLALQGANVMLTARCSSLSTFKGSSYKVKMTLPKFLVTWVTSDDITQSAEKKP